MTPDEAAAHCDELRDHLTSDARDPATAEQCLAVLDTAREELYQPDKDPDDVIALAALKMISILAAQLVEEMS